ncbi:MAG: 3-phosphoglycerate kinase [Myxococcota bacterium]|jgi:3-phosphoglycerate kinase
MQTRPNHRTSLLTGAALMLLGCSGLVSTFTAAELGRVNFIGPATGATTSATVAAGPVALWTDIDLEWEGDLALRYDVRIAQDGAELAVMSCDPLDVNVTMNSMTTDLGSRHTRRYQGLMHCTATIPTDGPIDVTAALSVTNATSAYSISRADLVIKQ